MTLTRKNLVIGQRKTGLNTPRNIDFTTRNIEMKSLPGVGDIAQCTERSYSSTKRNGECNSERNSSMCTDTNAPALVAVVNLSTGFLA
jgi:hypothetical protein